VRAVLAPIGMLVLRPQFLLLPLAGSAIGAAAFELLPLLPLHELQLNGPIDQESLVLWCQAISLLLLTLFLSPIYILSALACTQVWRRHGRGRSLRTVLQILNLQIRDRCLGMLWSAAEVSSILILAGCVVVGASLLPEATLAIVGPFVLVALCYLTLVVLRALIRPFVAFHATMTSREAQPLSTMMVSRELLSLLVVAVSIAGTIALTIYWSGEPYFIALSLPAVAWYGASALSTLTITTWQELSAEHVRKLQRGAVPIDVRPAYHPKLLPFRRRATTPLSPSELADIVRFVCNDDSSEERTTYSL
jgi:hypothetical protein